MANGAAVKLQLGRLRRGNASKSSMSPLLARIEQHPCAKRQAHQYQYQYQVWLSAVS